MREPAVPFWMSRKARARPIGRRCPVPRRVSRSSGARRLWYSSTGNHAASSGSCPCAARRSTPVKSSPTITSSASLNCCPANSTGTVWSPTRCLAAGVQAQKAHGARIAARGGHVQVMLEVCEHPTSRAPQTDHQRGRWVPFHLRTGIGIRNSAGTRPVPQSTAAGAAGRWRPQAADGGITAT